MTTQGIDRAGGGSDGGGGGGRTLRSFLESDGAQAKLAEVATKYMKPSDLVRLTLVAASRQPDLLRCSQTSILRALMDAATMGIMPGGTMGRGYLVPRKNKVNGALEACFDPGYRGLIDIARRSGKVKKLDAKAVWAGDHFEYEEGTNQRVHHVPNLEAGERGEVVAAYAIAKLEDGEPQIEVLTRADIDKIRNSSAAKNAGAWTGWFEEMARKSAVRRLCKYLPYDPVLERAMELADAADVGPSTASITDVRQIAARSSSSLNDLEEQLRRRQAGDALDLGGGGSVTIRCRRRSTTMVRGLRRWRHPPLLRRTARRLVRPRPRRPPCRRRPRPVSRRRRASDGLARQRPPLLRRSRRLPLVRPRVALPSRPTCSGSGAANCDAAVARHDCASGPADAGWRRPWKRNARSASTSRTNSLVASTSNLATP